MFELVTEIRSFFLSLPKKPHVILLGVSGGVDSMVLLDVLTKLSLGLGFKLIVSHIDHSLRDDSLLDREFVELECRRRGVECFSRVLVPQGSNIEAWGREERYKFFYELLNEHACDYLVTAHHKDDLAETFLFRFLSGRFNSLDLPMKAYDVERNLIRPLIDMSKEQIHKYAEENQINFREDSTNVDQTYRRNFIRHSIVPVLSEFEPTWEKHVCEYVEMVGELESFVLSEARKYVGSLLDEKQNLDNILLQKVLYHECAVAHPDDAFKISKNRMDELVSLIKDPKDYKRECDLGFGLYAVVDRSGAKNAGLSFLRRNLDLERLKVMRVTETEFKIECAGGVRGRVEVFFNKVECLDLKVKEGSLSEVYFHAFPKCDLDDLSCRFLEGAERVSIGGGRTRSVSKIFKDEKWNEERRRCTVLLGNGEQTFLLGSRFFPLEFKIADSGDCLFLRFSIASVKLSNE